MEYSIGKFATKIGRTVQTLRDWEKKGWLKPNRRKNKSGKQEGHRFYTEENYREAIALISRLESGDKESLETKLAKAIALLQEIQTEISKKRVDSL